MTEKILVLCSPAHVLKYNHEADREPIMTEQARHRKQSKHRQHDSHNRRRIRCLFCECYYFNGIMC